MNAVEVVNVTKSYGTHVAVEDLTLHVPQGTVYGFIGPNGSGKTTTLRMIMNILYPDRGQISVLGASLSRMVVDRVGYMPEERGIYRRMRVGELLEFFGRLKGLERPTPVVKVWLKRFGLAEWYDKKVETLSKGMSQKIQFIATVVARPELVLLDEPFTGLDPVNADVVREAILDLRSKGTTVIFSTHDMAMAERMCDFIFMIFRGRKVLDGTLASIQDAYGMDTVRVRTERGLSVLEGLPGVEKVTDFGGLQELRLLPGADYHSVLEAMVARTRVRSFDVVKPSLHEIFVRIAGPQAEEAGHA
ncbi:MAG: ATP-binding cassette domain-containing protein [Bacteroidetes bacterium]|jgi:ABC-2 type transport system ATP-binding protein|nr:ATP-binding cassette domain-containing protein [Bacteroidota bacterium]